MELQSLQKKRQLDKLTAVLFTFVLIYNMVCTQCSTYQLPESNHLIVNRSYQSLSHVPGSLSLDTTVLDLSYNNINELLISDFNYVPNLKVLNVSHNKIVDLNSNVFEFNKYLDFLDLSNNFIKSITGTFPKQLNQLDVSFNYFNSTSMCKGLGNLLHLEYLGLGAAQIRKSDFEAISHLHLNSVFIELGRLTDYENGSLLMLNTKKLHLVLPANHIDPYNVLLDAVNTSKILELSNIDGWKLQRNPNKSILNLIKNSHVTHLILSNNNWQFFIFIFAMQHIWHSTVESLSVNNITILGKIYEVNFDYSNTSMKEVSIEHVMVSDFTFDQGELYSLFAEMNIEHLTINHAQMLFMVCPSKSSTFQSLTFLDNALTDTVFQDCVTLTRLKTLKLGQNKFEKLSKVSSLTRNMPSLEQLDIRENRLLYDGEVCNWSQSVTWLNMAFCGLTDSVFQCLPINIKTLILNNNAILHVPNEVKHLEYLEELHLASNQLNHLPDCMYFSSLKLFNVESNNILFPSSESIQSCQHIKQIRAGHNPFECSCEVRSFINVEKESPGKLVGWPHSYMCDKPESMRGTKLNNIYIAEIQCNALLLIPAIVVPTVIVLILISCLCKCFDVPWFLKMIWQWTRTKNRIRNANKNDQYLQKGLLFHGFISYSEHDASWVKNMFLTNIEKDDGSIRICLHERDFIPGKSIIENIVSCIEKSYKSIFILSPHFVQSEWCHYELYFAHHKLYNENSDNLILILLEPIPQYIIPSRYYKLKALMAQRTYLEWPKEKSKHSLFWANLRAAIDVSLPDQQTQDSAVEMINVAID